MAKYVQNPAKAGTLTHIHQRSETMYEVTNNQKEQLLNQILNSFERLSQKGLVEDKRFIREMYRKVQKLPQGKSLKGKEALKLRSLIKSTKLK